MTSDELSGLPCTHNIERKFSMRAFWLLFLVPGLMAQSQEGIDFFESKIRPVLAKQCYACHSSKTKVAQGGLYVDSKDSLLKGGKSGVPAVVPGKPEQSLMILALRHANNDLKMPPGKQLSKEELADFEQWVKMGAPDPRTGGEVAALAPSYNWAKAKEHWSLQPLADPAVPAATGEWGANSIDRFIKAKLDKNGLRPGSAASKRVLARRLSFNLTGLPPVPAMVDEFVNDKSAGAVEKLAEKLMGTQQYAEHWGRHWLDVVRYADTAGDASDYPVHEAYRYRNYVIRSFRDDKPFDLFLREQLAGDLLPAAGKEDRADKIVATGYLAMARRFGQTDREHYLTIDDAVDNYGKAMLGLSLGCARCHDHKFDPLPATDYYGIYGILQSTKYSFAGMEHHQFPRNYVALDPEEQGKFEKVEARYVELTDKVRKMRADAIKPDAPAEKKLAYLEIKDELEKLKASYPKTPVAYGASDGTAVNAKVQVKGDPKIEGPEVPRGYLTVLGAAKVPEGHPGSGRDLLAQWTTDASNPLTARVIVNRVWQWHFGKGIVASPNDFGLRGQRPTHPELLDWLTVRFIESGWSIKKLNMLILTSRAWQSANWHDAANAEKDPNNEYYWRFDRRRLSAEELRDATLAVSGELDPGMGGAHPFPVKPVSGYTQHRPFVVEAGYATNKRTVYLMQQRFRRMPYMELFDAADTNTTTDLRSQSTTALQALYMMNSDFVHEQAGKLAVRAGMAYDSTTERLDYAYRLLFGRGPDEQERAWASEFLSEARKAGAQAKVPEDEQNRTAWSSLMRVMLNSNDFLYVD